MGNYLFKSDTLEFAVLPSENVEGPLGLGFPEDKNLNKVERETLIPALCVQHLRRNQCAEPWKELAECSKKWHWGSVAICRKYFDASMNCSRQYLSDPEFKEEIKKRYLELRAKYRSTGIEPKF